MLIISKQGQWLGDIAVREAGSFEAVVWMAANDDIPITGEMSVGSLVSAPTPIDKRTMNYYNTNKIYPATALGAGGALLVREGINYMGIEIDFIVS